LEFCEAVAQMKPDFEDIHFKPIGPVKVVSMMHYISGVWEVNGIEDWLTELQIPVVKL